LNGDRDHLQNTVHQIFQDPVVQLAALCPLCALAALSPVAALAAVSPVLQLFNPAVNPRAALIAFASSNPRATISFLVGVRVGMRLSELQWRHHANVSM